MKHAVHRHHDLLQTFNPENGDLTSGFSVDLHELVKREEFLIEHFRSDYIIMCLVTSGNFTISIDLKYYELPVNGFIFASPHSLKKLVDYTEQTTISAVSFTGDFLNKIGISNLKTELFEYFSTKLSPYWQLDLGDAQLVSQLMEDLGRRNQHVKTYPFGKELLVSSFQTFLYEIAGLSQKYSSPAATYFSRKENLIIDFLQLVKQHFRLQRSVTAYAEMLNISAKYLTETVKEITGKSAGEMIDDVVMLEARYLLNDPVFSIGQVADMLNFNDQSFFGKFFKRHAGMSPKGYRHSLHVR